MMRGLRLFLLFLVLNLLAPSFEIAGDRPSRRSDKPFAALYREVTQSIVGQTPIEIGPIAGCVCRGALFETPTSGAAICQNRRRKKKAEVVLFEAPTGQIPGEDFSMAILLVDGRAVDWASCWTSNRIANQELLLEDVDGDGFVDVAFRPKKGCGVCRTSVRINALETAGFGSMRIGLLARDCSQSFQ